jgi:hypothetical protein
MSVHGSTIHNSPKVETIQMFISDEWMNKMWHVHKMQVHAGRFSTTEPHFQPLLFETGFAVSLRLSLNLSFSLN